LAGGLIRQQDIEELRERADIVEVVSEYVQLKKAGRYLKGLCPFHDEKTPSFHVDPARQLFHCFGCGEGGNVYGFLMKKEGLDFREAVETLAQRYGFRLHYQGSEAEGKRREGRRERLIALHQLAVESYGGLLRGEAGEKARSYLEGRGMQEEGWREFRLGYAPPQWDFLYRRAVKNGFTPQEIAESGLFVRGEKGFYDRFRDRVIFPIENRRNEVIGLGGRIMEAGEPKYLNSPETPIYVKGKNLYNLNRAAREIAGKGYAVIVEGYTDVIFLWQAGIRNVVATLGTALGEEHFRILSRLTDRVVLAFDADAAGLDASARSLAFLESFNLDLRVLRMPPGRDPADFVREAGKEAFMQLLEESVGLLEFSVDKVLSSFDPNDVDSKKRGIKKSIDVLLNLNADLVAEELLLRIADWAGADHGKVLDYYNRRKKSTPAVGEAGKRRVAVGAAGLSGDEAAESQALGIMLRHPWLVDEFVTRLDEEFFTHRERRQVVRLLLEMHAEGFIPGLQEGGQEVEVESAVQKQLVGRLEGSANAQSLVTSGVMPGEADGEDDPEMLKAQLSGLLSTLEDFYLSRQIGRLSEELRKSESRADRDHELEKRIQQELTELQRLREALKKGR
jgi:DNA primase